MMITRKHLPRRAVLRGLGATIALPLLDGMVPAMTALAQTAASPVKRFGAVYLPMGANMKEWTPASDGPAFQLSPILQTLAQFRDRLIVVTGLDSQPSDSQGEGGGQHSRVMSTWLTGVHIKKTEGADFSAGVSMDQIAAQQIGQATSLPSLEMGLESTDILGACDVGYTCAYTSTIAWKTPTTPLPMEVDPRAVFERMFGDGSSTDARARAAARRRTGSLLDSVTSEIARLQKDLGPRDRLKLAEYVESVRDAERRIQTAERNSSVALPLVARPPAVPAVFADYARLMFDLMALAYQSDMTRIVTFSLCRELSNRTYPEIGVPDPHHGLSHHADNPEKLARQAKLNIFHLALFGHLLEKLQSLPDGDGTLLDHTLLLFGSGMSDSNLHIPTNLPMLVVGGPAHGLTGGRHLRFPRATPLTNLQLTLLDRMGVRIDTFGDSTGRLNLLSV